MLARQRGEGDDKCMTIRGGMIYVIADTLAQAKLARWTGCNLYMGCRFCSMWGSYYGHVYYPHKCAMTPDRERWLAENGGEEPEVDFTNGWLGPLAGTGMSAGGGGSQDEAVFNPNTFPLRDWVIAALPLYTDEEVRHRMRAAEEAAHDKRVGE